jgi:hypothetical protein
LFFAVPPGHDFECRTSVLCYTIIAFRHSILCG